MSSVRRTDLTVTELEPADASVLRLELRRRERHRGRCMAGTFVLSLLVIGSTFALALRGDAAAAFASALAGASVLTSWGLIVRSLFPRPPADRAKCVVADRSHQRQRAARSPQDEASGDPEQPIT
jgi:hypothetical protein